MTGGIRYIGKLKAQLSIEDLLLVLSVPDRSTTVPDLAFSIIYVPLGWISSRAWSERAGVAAANAGPVNTSKGRSFVKSIANK